MPHTVFIDGAAGTTGLEIVERLEDRPEFELVILDDNERKESATRRRALNDSDFAILCLPDDAAVEAAQMLDADSATRLIDASSAHRTASGWIYGFPEIIGSQVIAGAKKVTNPGCYPTGFLALVTPLVRAKHLPASWPLTINAVSGFSGGGRAMIERFGSEEGQDIAWRGYGYGFGHKHLAEMQQKAGLKYPPVFAPAVVPAFRGMVVEVPLPLEAMPSASTADCMRDTLMEAYADSPIITVREDVVPELVLERDAPATDAMELFVFASPDGGQARLVARLDNLGKGASGAAVQNLNLMAGLDPTIGLALPAA
ncbi:N-acetyl-gamma-glutamyl-phosphate reductase [Paraurantiacibacter namhicola]|uniref:N-acetyl-gamma-glutamyl-phosphate reductase n=1 Tax=Paraurantiacibacter namhicola TaxID=645517 RepID=A0A1C7DAP7_9SPHN|nr:N-acetyl-gamma-glutamyl-phosphate reductase [Paraurantiacibacter namhicola]ANU08569.1 N-acetyl-gamma-glutamyl-phosphate reductase [Paraurantiacibacter namhicola]